MPEPDEWSASIERHDTIRVFGVMFAGFAILLPSNPIWTGMGAVGVLLIVASFVDEYRYGGVQD